MNRRLIQIALLLAEAWERRAAVVCGDPLERAQCDRCQAKAAHLRDKAAAWQKEICE